jgi:putative membrane protein
MAQSPNSPRGMDDPTQPNAMNRLDSSQTQQQMDKKFVESALQGGMAEVELGKLALGKSSNDDVKKFARRMIDDHTKLGNDMKPVAEQIGVKMPPALSKKDQALEAKLETLSGPQFDKAYIQAMVKDHKKDYAEFQQEAQSAVIPAVKEAAMKGEPVIKSHLDEIEQISKSSTTTASVQPQ